MLGESPATIAQDLTLCEAMAVIPELKKCKNKAEAQKLLDVLAKNHSRRKILDKFVKDNTTNSGSVKSQLINSYIVGDCIPGMKGLQSESFDLIEIDPPYGIDLADQKKSMLPLNKVLNIADYTEVSSNDVEYVEFINLILDEAKRIVKPTGWVILWFPPERFDIIFRAFSSRFLCKPLPGEWIRGVGQTKRPELYFGNACEWFFYGRASELSKMEVRGKNSAFEYHISSNKFHPAEKPIDLLEDIYEAFIPAGGKILIPFLGSGNGIMAASNIGCTAIGYDLPNENGESHYKNEFSLRVMDGEIGSYTSYSTTKEDKDARP